jgi:hypothetical protein
VLRDLKTQTRRLFKRAKMTGEWGVCKESLTRYNREIRKAKRSSWRGNCQGIEAVPGSGRLMRIMAKQANNRVSSVKLPDGRYRESGRETLLELYRIHFPDFRLTHWSTDGLGQSDLGGHMRMTNRGDWKLVRRVIDQSRIKRAFGTFRPFKTAGIDEIVPALLQHGVEHLVPHLCSLFRACLAYGYIPKAWRQTRVTFIPKPEKASYTEAKAYRSISYSSFLSAL